MILINSIKWLKVCTGLTLLKNVVLIYQSMHDLIKYTQITLEQKRKY